MSVAYTVVCIMRVIHFDSLSSASLKYYYNFPSYFPVANLITHFHSVQLENFQSRIAVRNKALNQKDRLNSSRDKSSVRLNS